MKDVDGSDLSHETFKRFAHSMHGEDGQNSGTRYAMANASFNYIKRNTGKNNTNLKKAFAPDSKYSSVPEELKQGFSKGASEESKKSSFAAVINAITNGFDYSFGAIRWDGVDLAEKGPLHNVPLSGVFIESEHFRAFGSSWSNDLIAKNRGHNRNSKHSIWNNSDYHQNGYIQLGTSRYNEDAIRYSSTVVVGQVIFWKPVDIEIGKWIENYIERPIRNYYKSLIK